jgi:hypothetical protein
MRSKHAVDLAHQMVGRNDLVEVERIEELPLAGVVPPIIAYSHPQVTELRFAANLNRVLQKNRSFADVGLETVACAMISR